MSPGTFLRGPRVRSLALIAAIVGAVALLWQSDETVSPTDVAKLRGTAEPDSFVVGGRFLSFSESGHLSTSIQSKRVEQFEEDRTFRMQQPRATLFGEAGKATWQMQAEQGTFAEARERIFLTGDVRLRREAEQDNPLSLLTPSLTLNTDERTAYTSDPVEINNPLGITRATGMKAWLDERILELNSQVEGRYEPGK